MDTGRECELCRGRFSRLLVQLGDYDVYECLGCGLGSLSSQRTARAVAVGSGYYEQRVETAEDWQQWKEGSLAQFHAILDGIRTRRGAGKLLDVGCGGGFFLELCRGAGYDISGLDVSDAGAAHAERTLGIKIWRTPLEEVGLPDGSFDVITLNNVLEHLPHPRRTLAEAFRLLRTGGVLSISVPNLVFGKLALVGFGPAEWLGRANPAKTFGVFHVPEHLYHFSPKTLRLVCESVGFTDVRINSEVPVHNPGRSIRNVAKTALFTASERVRWLSNNRLVIGHGLTAFARRPSTLPRSHAGSSRRHETRETPPRSQGAAR